MIQMDLRKLDFPDKSFDGVFANYSLIHIPEKDVTMSVEGIARVLKLVATHTLHYKNQLRQWIEMDIFLLYINRK